MMSKITDLEAKLANGWSRVWDSSEIKVFATVTRERGQALEPSQACVHNWTLPFRRLPTLTVQIRNYSNEKDWKYTPDTPYLAKSKHDE